jgi:hypothetical protein
MRFINLFERFKDNQNRHDLASILCLIACGQNKIKDIAHVLKKPLKLIAARIVYLLEFDYIRRNGDFLTINDRLFSFWLKFVYKGKMEALTFNAVNQNYVFKKNIEGLIFEFLSVSAKPVSERIQEVLRLFADDRIQMENKPMRLTHFREIKPVELSGRGMREGFVCRSQDSLWLVVFKNDSVTEEDVALFSHECKKFKHKLERKIIVTLQKVDQNSRLRALEEKILTWDLSHLNQLFDLFSKPRLIACERESTS